MLLDNIKKQTDFTAQEKEVANYILRNLDNLIDMNTHHISKGAFTSPATVVRMAKKLGFNGFNEFKIKLIAEINRCEKISALSAKNRLYQNASYADVLHTIPRLYEKVISTTLNHLEQGTVLKIKHFLETADNIIFFGTGISYCLAEACAYKLETLGYNVKTYNSLHRHFLANSTPETRNLYFLISFTGENRSIIEIARYLSAKQEKQTVALAGPHFTELKKYCRYLIELPNRDNELTMDVMYSSIALNFVGDLFFSLLLADKYDEQIKILLKDIAKQK